MRSRCPQNSVLLYKFLMICVCLLVMLVGLIWLCCCYNSSVQVCLLQASFQVLSELMDSPWTTVVDIGARGPPLVLYRTCAMSLRYKRDTE